MAKRKSEDTDLLAEARDEFARLKEAEADNRDTFVEDVCFSRDDDQWPEEVAQDRTHDNRPMLTINKLKQFIRQVVNDARQNKPAIKTRPLDSRADVETAKVLDGIIRHIEHASDADVAYDTAVEYAASGGWGYIRVGIDYAHEDAFDADITINRVANPLSVYGDPDSTAADSKDWETAFVVDRLGKYQFERKWGDKSKIDWEDDTWKSGGADWHDGKTCQVAEWWRCSYEDREISLFLDPQTGQTQVYDTAEFERDADLQQMAAIGRLEFKAERIVKAKRFKQHILTGAEVLDTVDWVGKYIPIVPVYGDEFQIEGKRYLRSLIYSAKDAQRMFNYWRTTATELVALAPRVPWIGPVGAFATDRNWSTANRSSHAYLEYDQVGAPPQRTQLDSGVAAGALQEALNASDDMKAITGLYDASLGARSNETSGKAIMARQREGDVSTFHFTDNLSRAIRQVGRIVLDLVPHVYDRERIVRVLGEDGTQSTVTVNAPYQKKDKDGQPEVDKAGNAIIAMHDLTVGKYDISVTAGPSFTTRREEAAMQMTEMVRAFPQAAPYVADIMARNFDWPGADEIAERFKALVPAQAQNNIPPELMQVIQQGKQMIGELQQKLQALEADKSAEAAKAQTSQFDAETKRMKVQADIGMDIVDRLTPAPEYNGEGNGQSLP